MKHRHEIDYKTIFAVEKSIVRLKITLWSWNKNYTNPNHTGGGLYFAMRRKNSEKCSDYNNTVLRKRVSLFDTALVLTKRKQKYSQMGRKKQKKG